MGGGDRVARQPSRRDAAVRVRCPTFCHCFDPASYGGERLAGAVARLRRPRRLPPDSGRRRQHAGRRPCDERSAAERRRAHLHLPAATAACDSPTARPCGPRTSAPRSSASCASMARSRRCTTGSPAPTPAAGSAATSRRASRPTPRRERSPSTSGDPTPSSSTSSPAPWPTCCRRGLRRRSSAATRSRVPGPTRSRAFSALHGVAARAQPALSLVVGRGAPRRVPRRDHRQLLRGREQPR